MSQLHKIIQEFNPIGLEEMDSGTKLMNRVDTKFVLNVNQLVDILPRLKEEYRILEIDSVRFPSYESEYFDDSKLTFYIDHHRKKVDRYKVRFRKYIESDIAFLEVKHKKKGRTDKQRIKVDDLPGMMSQEHNEFVKSTGVTLNNLDLVLTNKFSRITFVGINHNERLTFDFDLSFFNDDKEVVLTNLVIAELKQARVIRTSPFYAVMKELLIRPFRISKYCIGIIELYGKENVKYNRFKKKLLKINKLRNNVA
ncbi:MAG: polyphosphate polymerase domain-containing protein [Crocinitomicaceae bacterium]|nr:polyphosphate polymerase domain-containing protein [Crocinitomicaceae bacterium]